MALALRFSTIALAVSGRFFFAPAFHLDVFGQDAVTGIVVMLGAELGTCSDTLLATISRGRAALKTGLFHLGFNAVSITPGLLLIQLFTALVLLVAGHADIARQIAHAHVLFNVAGVLLFAHLVPLCQRLLDACLPDKEQPAQAA